MKKATTVLRHYSSSAAAMRQDMRTMQAHYLSHQAAFQAFNPEFDAAFGTDWLAAIDLADTTPDNTVRVGELMQDTAEVQDTMTQAQQAVQSLFYFVGRAYPHNAGRLATYGRSTYETARNSHDKMRTLLQTAFTSATRDKTELAAKGYTPAMLAALGTLVTQLADTNTTQEVKKGTNQEGTDHYLTTQNLAYGFGQEVSAAAKVLFAADAATLKLFRLSGPAAPVLEHHEVTLAPGARDYITFDTPLLPTSRLHLRLAVPKPNQDAVVGRMVAGSAGPTQTVTLTTDQSEMDVLAPDLGPAGQVFRIQNGSDDTLRIEIGLLK